MFQRRKRYSKDMKGTSKVIMGATLVMVVTLAVVLGLILVLLAELYCSLLLRRRQLRNTNSNTIPTATTQTTTTTIDNASSSPSNEPNPQQHSPPPPPFSSSTIYSQGVLQAPRSFLFPSVSCTEEKKQNHHSEHHDKVIEIQTQESNASPLASFISRAPPKPVQEEEGSSGEHHFVYISNPIYENEEGRGSEGNNTPFETPDTSPSRLERSGSSGDDDAHYSPTYTPPLTPMKKLPAEACSVSLKDATSLNTSGSDSHSINGLSSSSSGSPRTSPSW